MRERGLCDHLPGVGSQVSHTMTDTWTLRIRAMIADGRLTFDKEVNGKKLYILDRKRLGMA